ncbi:C40 family peptidase [Streptomyces bugieae]|uniref:NlpC/P60 family protein n=1 Tax=Streptomyces bugieae TaxID=3098223 RepID=A0ABU7NU79_9ACTN|nr:NlpC/P60 family protein [Streptomyces sp. DSM 41528]
MGQHTLLPRRQAPKKQTARKGLRSVPVSHRRPRTPGVGAKKIRNGMAAVAGLAVGFVLSVLAGVLLAVHGPSDSSAAGEPSLTLRPEAPAVPKPAKAHPAKPAEPDSAKAKPAKVKKIVLLPGATLWELARTHGTTVKQLQRLNDLGSSTLIYAGQSLRVPVKPDASTSTRPAATTPSVTAPAPGRQPATTPTARPARPTRSAAGAVAYARAQLGKPYVWGGAGPRGFDCSGLVMRAWQAAGVTLPRTTWGQIHAGTATTRSRLVPGDLVLSYGGGHVGLYIGDGQVIHAPRPGTVVTVAPLPDLAHVVAYRHINQ